MLSVTTLESMFGSDEAIGVRFRVSKQDAEEVISSTEYAVKYGHLQWNEMPDSESLMPDGSSATVCTNYAHHVRTSLAAMGFHVDVVGFANDDNPTSQCAIHEFHPEGHDFAVVEHRYLVDPWVRLVAAVEDQIVYDLHDSTQLEKALTIYGPRNLWLPLG